MPRYQYARASCLALCAALALSGCKSDEDKAEAHYQSAQTLLAEGDPLRAMVELRNVFEYDGTHKAARRAYADLLLAQGRLQEAFSQYLRLLEQYPETVDVHRILAELSLRTGNLPRAQEEADAVKELAPDDPGAQAVQLALDLRDASLSRDTARRSEIAATAEALTEAHPEILTGWHVLIDARNAEGDDAATLTALDAALTRDPAQYRLQVLKLELISKHGSSAEIGAQLEVMQRLFPEDTKTRTALIAWYVLRDDPAGAARFLRKLTTDRDRQTSGYLELVRFLARAKGADAARAELDSLIAQSQGEPNEAIFTAMRADLDFQAGDRAAALARMQALITRHPDSEEMRQVRTAYARMLDHDGQREKAKAEIAAILKTDPTNVPALQQRATWRIEEDRTDLAITDLRSALQQSPDNPQTLTLLGETYMRDGAPDLALGQFSQAYDAAGRAAPEAIRYVDFLFAHDRASAARTVLAEAVEVTPNSPGLLKRQADLALADHDWALAHRSADRLAALAAPGTEGLAQSIRAAILLGRGRSESAIETVKTLVQASGPGDDGITTATAVSAAAVSAVVQAQLASGRGAEARAYLDAQLEQQPGNRGLRLLAANLSAIRGDTDQAEAALRTLMHEAPADPRPARQLYRLLASQGREGDALAVIQTALEKAPQADPVLLLYRARSEEKSGRFDAAIATYDDLYTRDSSDLIVANNLASLLSSHRDDRPSLERAARIAKRFRERPEPAFKDTYGWTEYRLGNYGAARPLLAAAAAGLPENALAQYHYAAVLIALEETDLAEAALRDALRLAGAPLPPAMQGAQEQLAALTGTARAGSSGNTPRRAPDQR
ncbi:hypothetical protein B6V74_01375 [Thioclava sp. F42-5]|uniref:tetratricopeptide repeat protein n=1 Tax=Thioclava sp. F42-5 TaxID=1973005 RepID=UPI000B546DCE|nr:tetratricopeptide repeat protein [Thioclava sp. F42-5]OWY10708.1 hypothetical protein B6V74_01375 [Thioclava sp. F42-5]